MMSLRPPVDMLAAARRLSHNHKLTRPRGLHIHAPSLPFLRVSDEVREAVENSRPVVALETTIYTHGSFPYPQNVALAAELESVVRQHGGVPATVGILNGIARVGLLPSELEQLTSSAGKRDTLKISRRDLAYACGTRLAGKNFNGGTTISGTMVLAHLAGICIFATGGLGGVHRGAESSMDVSADLTELGRTPLTVISSGCKSFLDIARTLEYLETEGVGVATFADGREGAVDFPAFWARDCGVKSPMTIGDEDEAAAIIYAHKMLKLESGLLLANPVPTAAAIARGEIDGIIAQAVRDGANVAGKDNTPFILARIKELTGGKSVAANRALVMANVKRGTLVAKKLAALEAAGERSPRVASAMVSPPPPANNTLEASADVRIVVAGSIAVDLACDYAPVSPESPSSPALHTSNPATIRQSMGGVGFNVARAISRLGQPVRFCSLVGNDLSGRAALAAIESDPGLSNHGISVASPAPESTVARTARYIAVNDQKKDLVLAMADMSIYDSSPASAEQFALEWGLHIAATRPSHVVVDTNWHPSTARLFLKTAKTAGALSALEPVSVAKAARLFSPPPPPPTTTSPPDRAAWFSTHLFPTPLIDIANPNALELAAMHAAAKKADLFDSAEWWRVIDALGIPSSGARVPLTRLMPPRFVDRGIPQQAIQLLPYMPTIITKLGKDGVILTEILAVDDARLRRAESSAFVLSRAGGANALGVGGVYIRYFPPEGVVDEDVVSVNGVGDVFLGAIVAGLAKHGGRKRAEELVPVAQRAAVLTLRCGESVGGGLEGLRDEL